MLLDSNIQPFRSLEPVQEYKIKSLFTSELSYKYKDELLGYFICCYTIVVVIVVENLNL